MKNGGRGPPFFLRNGRIIGAAMQPAKSEPTRRRFLPRVTLQRLAFLLAALPVFTASTTWAHEGEDDSSPSPPLILGVLDFPNSGSDDAQDAFDRGGRRMTGIKSWSIKR